MLTELDEQSDLDVPAFAGIVCGLDASDQRLQTDYPTTRGVIVGVEEMQLLELVVHCEREFQLPSFLNKSESIEKLLTRGSIDDDDVELK